MGYLFVADQHFGHVNIIRYCNRPFKDVKEMDEVLIQKHNEVVGKRDVVVHLGDFTLISNKERVRREYIKKLKGQHIFLKGSHDYWLPPSAARIWEKEIDGVYVVACHYAMRTWVKSHWNSWQVYAHSHGRLEPIGKQWDVGVDNNNFYPVSFERLKEIMKNRPNNFNFIREGR